MSIGTDLKTVVDASCASLLTIDEALSEHVPAPGKWCAKQVLGHLIDSATNNHKRFVEAQFRDALVFPGYDQDEWVQAQKYESLPWTDLVQLWRSLNLLLAHVFEGTPEDVRERSRPEHNLHRIAFHTVPESEPVTLAYFMGDYVQHLAYHLAQIERTVQRGGSGE